MKRLFGKWEWIVLAALAVLLANGVISWRSIDTLADQDAWVAHTHEVQSELKILLPTLAKANEARLPSNAPKESPLPILLTSSQALDRVGETLANLQALTEDNQGQQQRLARLRALCADHFRAGTPLPTALAHRKWLAETKRLLDEMGTEERRLLQQRAGQSRGSRRVALVTQALTTALTLTALCVIVWLARSDARHRRRIADNLRRLNEDLEKRVAERTGELAVANDGLRRAKEDAEANQRRSQLIVESAYDAYVAMNADGVIVDWNRQAEKSFGWSRELVVGRPLHEVIIPPRYREEHVRGLRRFLDNGQGPMIQNRIEVSALHRDGHEFPVELSISPLRLGDEWIFSAFLHDISERQRAAEELRLAKEAAETANRAKSEFLANMSHEIRTPMNGILGMTELVLDTKLDDEQREHIVTVQDSAQSLLTIINDILDFSKIEAGKMELDPESFVLRNRLIDTLKPLVVRARKKGVELVSRVAPDVPVAAVADWNRLQQILLNLVGNAIKFTQHGEIVVDVRREGTETDNASCLVHFSVRDTGLGIPADKREAIFAPFAQADGKTARRFGGTGLGLTISSQLVALMGGRIWVESEVGRGSTFHFTVRLATPPPSGSSSSAEVSPPRGDDNSTPMRTEPYLPHLRILLAEDNIVNQRVCVRMLENRGHTVVLANNGHEALAALASASFDVVLMDVQMPEMDGFEATAEVRRHEADTGGHVPIVALTAHAMKGDRERCLAAGMDCYVSKPLQAAKLLDAISAARLAAPPLVAPSRRRCSPFDKAVILERVGGDAAALREVAELFRQDAARLLKEIDDALAQGDARRLQRSAHSLKGSASLFGADEVSETASELEQLSEAGEATASRAVVARLSPQVEELCSALASLETDD